MPKINLFANTETIKLGELSFDLNQFSLPKTFFVDFSKASLKNKWETINGENKQTDILEKIVIPTYNGDVVKVITEAGESHESLKSVDVTIMDNLEAVKLLIDKNYCGNVKFQSLTAKPKWVSLGGSGSFNDVRLVAQKVEKSG